MSALLSHYILILIAVNIKLPTAVSQCKISDSLLSRYWTHKNKFKPDGCIDRSNVSLVQIDHGGIFSTFFYLPRGGATRACSNYGSMKCDITTTEQYDLTSMANLIESVIYRNNVFGLSITLPTTEFSDELQIVHDEGITIYTWNSGIDEYVQFHSKLHVGQDEYVAGYRGCLHLKEVYGANKILMIDVEHGTNMGLILRARGCTFAMNNNTKTIYTAQTNLQVSAQIIANELINDIELDGILALAQTAETSAHYILSAAVNSGGNDSYGLTKERAEIIKAVGTFDYTQDILNHVLDESSFTKFIIDQQPYLQGFLPIYFMGIEATTANHIIDPALILSGPAFVETAEHIALLHCNSEDVFYCHDSDEHLNNMVNGCSCIDTLSKIIYLFHHAGYEDVGTAMSDFYSILVSGAEQAAIDINVTLEINTYETEGNQLDLEGYLQFMKNIIYDNIDDIHGVITTVPNQQIGDLLLDEKLAGKEVIGVAEGYGIYKDLQFDKILMTPMFIGMDDENAGYNISDLIHVKANKVNVYNNNTVRALLCLDHELGSLNTLIERCVGVERYCIENGLVYRKINTDASNIDGSLNAINTAFDDLLSVSVVIEGIIGTGESSCLSGQYFINNIDEEYEQQGVRYDSIILGCFDTSPIALDGLLSNSVDFVFDQQPWLIGYTSMIMMTNKLLIDLIPSQLLIETGPILITFDDKHLIYAKECENYYKGYEFCPNNAKIIKTLQINFPTLNNFAGIVIIIFFILTLLVAIFILLIMYIWRYEPMFKALQPEFMVSTIFGGIIMMMSGLFMLNNEDSISDYTCNIPWTIWSIGFTIFFCSYSLRVWKFVNVLENGLLFKQVLVTRKNLLIRLFIFVLIDIILNILANTITPFHASSHTEIDDNKDAFTEMTTSYCSYFSSVNDSNSIWVLIIVYKFCILFWVIAVGLRKKISSDKMRKLRFIKFQEGSNITIGIYMVLVSFIIFGLISFALITSSNLFTLNLQWIICSFLSFLCYLTIIFCVTLHRIVYVYRKNKEVDINTNNLSIVDHKSVASTEDNNKHYNCDSTYALDPYYHRAEFLVSETIDMVQNNNFTSSAAVALNPLVQKLVQNVIQKEQSGYASSEKSAAKSKHITSDNHVSVTNDKLIIVPKQKSIEMASQTSKFQTISNANQDDIK